MTSPPGGRVPRPPRRRRAARPHIARPALLALALVLVPAITGARPAGAQAPTVPPLHLVGQTTWVAEDQPFDVALRVTAGLPVDGTVEITLYGAVTSRETLVLGAADPSSLGAIRDTLSIPTALVPQGENGAYRLRLATDGSAAGLPVSAPGVYPVAIAVAGPDGVAGEPLVTFLVRTPEDAGATALATAVVLPIHAAPSYPPDGPPVVGEGLRRLVEVRSGLLERYPQVPLTVVPTPETLDALAQADPDLLGTLREAVADRHVVAGTYVRLDLAAWAADNELTGALEDQFEAGARALRRTLGRRTDQRTWAGQGNPTTAAIDALADAGIDRALFRQEAVTPIDGEAPVTEPVVVTGVTGQSIDAVLADPAVRAHVNGTVDPVLMAHRALADLALLAAPPDDGGVATDDGDAGVAVELAANRPLPAAFLNTLLQGLALGGPLRPVTLAALFDTDPAGEPGPEPGPSVGGGPAAGQDLSAYGRNLAVTRQTVRGYATFAGRADPLVADLQRRLLVSGALELPEVQRGAYLSAVSQDIRSRTAEVRITDDETVTLTSRSGNIPVTIHNDTGGPVDVVLAFDSDNKLEFPDGATRRLSLAEGPNQIEVPVVARTSGSFPLRITATSPDGVLTVGRARLTVRSTVVSGVGLVLSIGAGLVLVGWWARHWHSTRRNRRLIARNQPPATAV